MKIWHGFVFLSLAAASVFCKAEAVIVVANTPDKSIHLNRQQVRDMFMGIVSPYDFKVIALSPNNQARVVFNTKVIGLTESRIQSYWAQMRFTGRKTSPVELQNEQLLLDFLKENEFSVGYVSSTTNIPEGLTVIFETE